ncbi:MAG: nitrile hydratase subunit alpha [bacterium]|nr:nitrile hydratase subunit alpha [bacterium]
MSDRDRVATPVERVEALERALADADRLPDGAIDRLAENAGQEFDWRNGARVVAKAWSDPDYRARLLVDGTKACAELGFEGPQGEYIVVLENTPTLHNAVVCTQCSCTAWPVLGLPPDWYKAPAYRARIVRAPRGVLREMGVELAEDVRVRITDTTAETRFLVLPLRPDGTEGWSEDELAAIVTRESMIGVALVSLQGVAPAD